MCLYEWIQHHMKTHILRFEHLDQFLEADAPDIEAYLSRINPLFVTALRSDDGITEWRMVNDLESVLLGRFKRRHKKVKVTLEIELDMSDYALVFCKSEQRRIIERVMTYMTNHGIKNWRIVKIHRA